MIGLLARLRHPLLGRSGWLLAAYCIRLLFQAVAFLVLARALGPTGFGAFAAALAVASLLGPFVELGAYTLIIQDIVSARPVRHAIGESLLFALLALPFGLLALLPLKLAVLQAVEWRVLLPVALTTFVGVRLATISAAVHVAYGVVWRDTCLEFVRGGGQLAAAVIFSHRSTAVEVWSQYYLAQGLLTGIVSFSWVLVTWGRPALVARKITARLKLGLQLAVGLAAKSAYTDLDKALLARLTSLTAVGVYGAAQRAVGVANAPMFALMGALYPRFFQEGARGPGAARSLAWRVAPLTACLGLLSATAIWVGAPVISAYLGRGFADAANALRFISALLVLQALYVPFADAMTASGFQAHRTAAQAGALLVNIGLDVRLIPALGWRGAGLAALTTQALLVVFFFLWHPARPVTVAYTSAPGETIAAA